MAYTVDPVGFSLIWGRIGATVLGGLGLILGLFGYEFSETDQVSAFTLIGAFLSGGAGLYALISKIRENKRAK